MAPFINGDLVLLMATAVPGTSAPVYASVLGVANLAPNDPQVRLSSVRKRRQIKAVKVALLPTLAEPSQDIHVVVDLRYVISHTMVGMDAAVYNKTLADSTPPCDQRLSWIGAFFGLLEDGRVHYAQATSVSLDPDSPTTVTINLRFRKGPFPSKRRPDKCYSIDSLEFNEVSEAIFVSGPGYNSISPDSSIFRTFDDDFVDSKDGLSAFTHTLCPISQYDLFLNLSLKMHQGNARAILLRDKYQQVADALPLGTANVPETEDPVDSAKDEPVQREIDFDTGTNFASLNAGLVGQPVTEPSVPPIPIQPILTDAASNPVTTPAFDPTSLADLIRALQSIMTPTPPTVTPSATPLTPTLAPLASSSASEKIRFERTDFNPNRNQLARHAVTFKDGAGKM